MTSSEENNRVVKKNRINGFKVRNIMRKDLPKSPQKQHSSFRYTEDDSFYVKSKKNNQNIIYDEDEDDNDNDDEINKVDENQNNKRDGGGYGLDKLDITDNQKYNDKVNELAKTVRDKLDQFYNDNDDIYIESNVNDDEDDDDEFGFQVNQKKQNENEEYDVSSDMDSQDDQSMLIDEIHIDGEISSQLTVNINRDSHHQNQEDVDEVYEKIQENNNLITGKNLTQNANADSDNEMEEDGDGNNDQEENVFSRARAQLYINIIPDKVPCRESEKRTIKQFIQNGLKTDSGGFIYIAGMPGTGKTTTVREIIRSLQNGITQSKVAPFTFIELNGMEFTDPNQLYTELYAKIKHQKKKRETYINALAGLKKIFTTKNRSKAFRVVLVDEFDQLIQTKQNVIYNLFEWPNKPDSKLIVIAISNTMNLPETLLPKVQSRMSLQKVGFTSYNVQQLKTIVTSRLEGLEAFDQDAIEICAMRVSAVCGDARKALDICREATFLAEKQFKLEREMNSNTTARKVTTSHIEEVLDAISSYAKDHLKRCSYYDKLFLLAMAKEQKHESSTSQLYLSKCCEHFKIQCNLRKVPYPNSSQVAMIIGNLAGNRLILVNEDKTYDFYQIIQLNVKFDDLVFALSQDPQISLEDDQTNNPIV
ncbi:origin recognition complex subunit 1 [Tieghemostelium lacteum]|uniref:Origin recognition complex subunit 1 n=1 Tax=Tieghemostelium lacteum TaxID=361077 RepID=A0A152A5N9_TIELA|nr:origin recognition complex subunit 1 [Tieghemostelium lacteum]|eukprot:KYR01552.1 origin recognition complex subunit 1 [Tieghemostelium lacteum]